MCPCLLGYWIFNPLLSGNWLVAVVMVGDVEGVVLPLVALHQPRQEVSLADPH